MDEVQFHEKVGEYLARCEEVQDCKTQILDLEQARKQLPSTDVNESFTELKTNLMSIEELERMARQTREEINVRKERALQRIQEIPNEMAGHLPTDKWVKHDLLAVCLRKNVTTKAHKKQVPTKMGTDARGNKFVTFGGEVEVPARIDGYILEFNDWERIANNKAPVPYEVMHRREIAARHAVIVCISSGLGAVIITLATISGSLSMAFSFLTAALLLTCILTGMTTHEILSGKRDDEINEEESVAEIQRKSLERQLIEDGWEAYEERRKRSYGE